MRRLKQILSFILVATLATFAINASAARAATLDVSATPQEAREIAAEAYVYFYPLVSMDVTRRQMTNMEPGANAFAHLRAFPDANFRAVVRPNFDTLYSVAWLDLTKGPMIVSAADTHGRYYLLPMLDMWSDVFAVPGKRTSGTKAANFAVVPPGWSGDLPAGVARIQSTTPYVWILGRTQTNGVADYPTVHAIQDGYKITPLALWGQARQPARFVADPNIDMKTPPKQQVDRMTAADFFHDAAELMKANPPHVTDWSTLERLARIGIVPGESFNLAALDPALQQAIEAGAADGAKTMLAKKSSIGRIVNGWVMNTDTVGVYGNYYLKRAIIAQDLLGANQPDDAVYPFNVADADGKPVIGGAKYVMHFTKAELPPVNAFWSLTMYDADGFQVANPINRFAIGDRDALKYNADGSLDIYIQHDNPGAARQANWLPSPANGTLGLTMRLYSPKPQVLEGSWAPPPVQASAS